MAKSNPLNAALHRAAGKELPTKPEESSPAAIRATTAKAVQANRRGKKTVIAYLDPAAVRELKLLGIKREMTQQDLLIEAINDLLVKYEMKPLA